MQEQSKAIAEAFAEDDVLASDFKSEKRAAVDAERPKDLDTFLDGWGTWGGEGIKESVDKLNYHSVFDCVSLIASEEIRNSSTTGPC